jgi:esterase/lipase
LEEDWTEIHKGDLLFDEEYEEETKTQSAPLNKIFGIVKASFARPTQKILPMTPKPNFQNNLKSSIFGFADKIKEKLKKPEEPKPEKIDNYMKQLSSEYKKPTTEDAELNEEFRQF